jgi:hypothetical protein
MDFECAKELEAPRNRVGGEAGEAMEHSEAIEMMASERYLLDELTPELRDAFEEHFFGCPECAQDVQFGAAFLEQTKVILPGIVAAGQASARAAVPARAERVAPVKESGKRQEREKREWFAWLRPAIMVPAFACLLALVGYQNLVVYPALEASATGPRILPAATVLHDETRSAVPVIYADLKLGSTIAVELPAGANYSYYKLEFYDSKGKMIWTRTAQSDGEDMLSFWLSSTVKQDTYKLVVSGVTATGEVVRVKQQIFELQIQARK